MQALTLLVAGWLLGAAPPQKGPEPLPDDVVKAWAKVGAEVGWMGAKRQYGPLFTTKLEELDRTKGVPAFKFKVWRAGIVSKLPVPATSFGLDLSDTEVTDA